MPSSFKLLSFHALLAVCSGLVVPAVQAQQVYRIVGPDGKVTFSDKPPAETSSKVTAAAAASGGASGSGALPFELRQVANKYPVTLYTGDNCNPCAAARSMLAGRGIPFTERTVNTADDGQALQRLSGENSLPFATIGGQQLKGYSDTEWTQFLDAAGYPKKSTLPPSYRQPAATPLVAVAQAAAPQQAASDSRSAPTAPAPAQAPAAARAPSNPAGIRF